ncbi:MAG: hypothetical protein EA377_06570 [Phycisphaerales bacterium]|nr:MAG: hypothetical protein EA377_06570 [Phycisphaerales bacterium]
MDMLFRRVGSVAVVLVLAGIAQAQPTGASNAATWYQKAFDLSNRLDQTQWQLIADFTVQGGTPTPELRAALDRLGPALRDLQRGTHKDHSDFGLDRSQGFFMRLDHIGPLRNMVRAANADAAVRLHDGDTVGAASRLASMIRVTDHFGDDRVIISSLVGLAAYHVADQTIEYGLDNGQFGALEAAELYRALDALDEFDPMNIIGAAIDEQHVIVDWMHELHEEDRVLELATEMYGDHPLVAEVVAGLDVPWEIERYDEHKGQVIAVMQLEDPEAAREAMAQLDAALMEGRYGTIARELSTAYSRVLERLIDSREMVASRKAMLKELAEGRVRPEEHMNAAPIYLRAASTLQDSLAEPLLEWLRSGEQEAVCELDDELTVALMMHQHVVSVIHDATEKQRCDFNAAVGVTQPTLAIDYALDVRDLLRFLALDMERLICDEQSDAAAERLRLALRLLSHLEGHDQPAVSMVAHEAAVKLVAVLGAFREGEPDLFGESETAQQLPDEFARLDESDPFGYLSMRQAVREHLQRGLRFVRVETSAKEKRLQANRAVIHDAQENQLAAILHLRELAGSRALQKSPMRCARWSAIFDCDALSMIERHDDKPDQSAAVAKIDGAPDENGSDGLPDTWPWRDLRTMEGMIVSPWLERRPRARMDLRELGRAINRSVVLRASEPDDGAKPEPVPPEHGQPSTEVVGSDADGP